MRTRSTLNWSQSKIFLVVTATIKMTGLDVPYIKTSQA